VEGKELKLEKYILDKLESHSEKLDKILKVLNGNGELGLVGKVIQLENWVEIQKNKSNKWSTFCTGIIRAVIIGLLLAILRKLGWV
jgi:hypothetical protein